MSISTPGVADYLGQVELALKQFSGVHPERVLCQLRDEIFADAKLSNIEEMDEEAAYRKLVDAFGNPASFAAARATDPQPPGTGNAPGWRICCTGCGRSSPADRHGIVRLGARSFHKYIVGRCEDCQKYVSCRIIRYLDRITLAPRLTRDNQPAEILARLHHPKATLFLIAVILVMLSYWIWW